MTDPKKARLMDKSFRYTPAAETNLHRTFARIRREQAEAAKKTPPNVRPMKKKEAK